MERLVRVLQDEMGPAANAPSLPRREGGEIGALEEDLTLLW